MRQKYLVHHVLLILVEHFYWVLLKYDTIITGLLFFHINSEDNTSCPLAVFGATRRPFLLGIIIIIIIIIIIFDRVLQEYRLQSKVDLQECFQATHLIFFNIF